MKIILIIVVILLIALLGFIITIMSQSIGYSMIEKTNDDIHPVNKNRTGKELIKFCLSEYEKDTVCPGLCLFMDILRIRGLITHDEYVEINETIKFYHLVLLGGQYYKDSTYFFPRFERKPRIQFLKDIIKELRE